MTSKRLGQLLALLAESPDDAFILFALAKEYEKLGMFDTAFEYYLKLTVLHPAYVGTYYHLGKLYEETEENSKAIDIYLEGIKIAKKINDLHALSELMNAKMNLEMELE